MQAVVGKQRKLSFILLGILLLLSMVAGSSHAQPIIPISGDENYIRVAPSELNYLLEEPGTIYVKAYLLPIQRVL